MHYLSIHLVLVLMSTLKLELLVLFLIHVFILSTSHFHTGLMFVCPFEFFCFHFGFPCVVLFSSYVFDVWSVFLNSNFADDVS